MTHEKDVGHPGWDYTYVIAVRYLKNGNSKIAGVRNVHTFKNFLNPTSVSSTKLSSNQ